LLQRSSADAVFREAVGLSGDLSPFCLPGILFSYELLPSYVWPLDYYRFDRGELQRMGGGTVYTAENGDGVEAVASC
jgi:hypothetical protein